MDSMITSKMESAFAEGEESASKESQLGLSGEKMALSSLGATEWHLGRPVGTSDRPVPDASTSRDFDPSGTIERISDLLQRETAVVRQHSSGSMAVVLRPDNSTELVVHLAQRQGQIEATVRCERGDLQHLSALWPQLQDSLAQQKVRLAPLQGASSSHMNFSSPGSPSSAGEGHDSRRHSTPAPEPLDERPALASSNPVSSRARGGSRRRLTTSRPGWETWA